MSDCIFCRLAAGELPASVVYETDDVLAFDDVQPQAPVHVLIIPKAHYEHLGSGLPDHLLGALLAAVPRVAEAKHVDGTGYRVIINTGRDAAQTVKHLHLHVLAGAPMAHGMVRFRENG